jgi:hypothetical protein
MMDPNGAPAHSYFEHGLADSYGNRTAEVASSSNSGAEDKSESIHALQLKTLYHYRVGAYNNGGTSDGQDLSFRTLQILTPRVLLPGFTNLTPSSVTIRGLINPISHVGLPVNSWTRAARVSNGFKLSKSIPVVQDDPLDFTGRIRCAQSNK